MNAIPRESVELEALCMPFIRGESQPDTAAELMASRYVAYTVGEIDYLLATHAPETRDGVDRKDAETWSRKAEWRGLEIVATERGGPEDDDGVVEFIARYAMDGVERTHHERSTFRRQGGRWYFVDGQVQRKEPVRRAGAKVGRNDDCPCGSGKKYKKCCGRGSAA